jgi:hypothetical protein
VGAIASGQGEQGGEQMPDLVAGDRDQPWYRVACAFGQGGDDQEGVGEHGERDPTVPGAPAADLVLVQTTKALAGLECLLHRPPPAGDFDQDGQRGGVRGEAAVEGQLAGLAVAANARRSGIRQGMPCMACKGPDSRLSRQASGGLMMPRDLIARADKELVNQMIKRPLAWIPVAMSLAILAMVLTTIGLSGAVRQEDEGTQAHIFQIWLVLEVVLVAGFAVAWVPRRPKQALVVLALQILCALAACAPVFYFRL